MMRFTSLEAIILLAVAVDCSSIWDEYLNAVLAADVCTAAGEFSCSSDCTTLKVCVESGHGLAWLPTVDCSTTGQYCSKEEKGCVDERKCAGPEILCGTVGYYPDPTNCKMFHLCYNENLLPPETDGECSPGFGYDPCTKVCDVTLPDDKCTYEPIPSCKTTGQSGALPSNNRIYYTCLNLGGELKYVLSTCSDGYYYNSNSGECEESDEPGCEEGGTSTTQPSSATTPTDPTTTTTIQTTTTAAVETTTTVATTTTIPSSTSCSGITCWKVGYIADPCDCRGYYYCNNLLQPLHLICNLGYHYDNNLERCVLGNC